jgi:predicted PurR-regulated permease PerM
MGQTTLKTILSKVAKHDKSTFFSYNLHLTILVFLVLEHDHINVTLVRLVGRKERVKKENCGNQCMNLDY